MAATKHSTGAVCGEQTSSVEYRATNLAHLFVCILFHRAQAWLALLIDGTLPKKTVPYRSYQQNLIMPYAVSLPVHYINRLLQLAKLELISTTRKLVAQEP